jgi:hypothetical protein
MKQQIKYIAILGLGLFISVACNKKIESLQNNPNNPTNVPPNLILGTILTDISGTGAAGNLGTSSGTSNGVNSWGYVAQWDQYHCQNYNYYGNNIYSWSNGNFDPYLVLKNVAKMDSEAARIYPPVNPYEAVGRFVNAYYYYNLASLYGDVPQAESIQGAANFSPSYTAQKQVFLYVLNILDSANNDLASLIGNFDNTLFAPQDLFYQGDFSKWQKLVNSFKLRVLISLSNKSTDQDLNIATQFANIINNPTKYPVFGSQGDDFAFNYNPGNLNTYSTYPFNPSNFGSIAGRYNMAYTYVNALTTLNDPRVYVTCEPAWSLVGTDTAHPAQFQYFIGASTGEAIGTMYSNASANEYSFINRNRYYSNFTGEPNVLVGFKEMLFNIAEAMARGWVSGSAETYYRTGIGTSMGFYGIDTTKTSFTAYFLPPGANSVTQVAPYPFNFDFSIYYTQPAVKFSSITDTAITQIVLQKYIACFQNSGYEGYYNSRRTGVPAFQGGTGIGNNGIIPKRWAYPVSEQTQNKANWSAALTNQSYSADDINQVMWLLK